MSEPTLRVWEARHGFPVPRRLPSGHRRYSERDVGQVLAVVRARQQGLSLPVAIDLTRRLAEEPRASVFGALRHGFPRLQAHLLPRDMLVALTQAIEDECLQRARGFLLFGAFQEERFYRRAEERWRAMGRAAELAVAFADFTATRRPAGGPIEVSIDRSDQLMREWVIVCDAPRHAACLVGWERPPGPTRERRFETVWSVDPAVVREAARVCAGLAARAIPELGDDLAERLGGTPRAEGDELAAMADLTTRMVLYAGGHG